MKLVLSIAELQLAVADYLKAKVGYTVEPSKVAIKTRTEGQWDDATLHLDGAEVEIEGHPQNMGA